MTAASLVPARARRTYGPRPGDVKHLVEVDEHDGPKTAAVCGFKPTRGWVLDTTLSMSCASCYREETT